MKGSKSFVILFLSLGLWSCGEDVEVGSGDTEETCATDQDCPTPQDPCLMAVCTNSSCQVTVRDTAECGEECEGDDCGECVATTVYADTDEDGYGAEGDAETACLAPGEPAAPGFTRLGNDCDPDDPWRHPGSHEICGDWVDDDCDGSDEECPTTAPSTSVPTWDCQGDPPNDVYAWASFSNDSYASGSCLMIFQTAAGDFYAMPNVTQQGGSVCGSWDERLYAFTLQGETDACPELELIANFDNNPEDAVQPVSTSCRRFLHAMTRGDDISYVGTEVEAVEERLAQYPNLEIACAGYLPPYSIYGWRSIVVEPFTTNMGFVAQ